MRTGSIGADGRKWRVELSQSGTRIKADHRQIERVTISTLGALERWGKLGNGRLRRVLRDHRICTLSILLTSDAVIRQINYKFRGKNKPTDVLSFPTYDEESGGFFSATLGDLVVSLPTAKRQAPLFGNDFEREIERLLIHGILHLCGYDHEGGSKREEVKMFRLEDELANSRLVVRGKTKRGRPSAKRK